jgi:hypothetical protein
MTIIYLKNPATGQVITGEAFGIYFDSWETPSQSEIDAYKLQEAKTSKIAQLKINRDNANIADMVSHQGFEIIQTNKGSFQTTENLVYFRFKIASTNNPASEPNSVCFGVIFNSYNNPLYQLRYSCTIIDENSTRKGYVAIDKVLASSIMSHAIIRNTNNISLCNQIEKQINSCTTLEEVEAINIEF